MRRGALRSIVAVVLVVALGSSGCFRDVARIHIDESQRLTVTPLRGSEAEDPLPRVQLAQDGAQQVDLAEGYKYRLEVSWAHSNDKGKTTLGGIRLYQLSAPAQLRLELDHDVTISDTEGEYRYSAGDRDPDVGRFVSVDMIGRDDGATAVGILLASILGAVLVVGVVALIVLSGGHGM